MENADNFHRQLQKAAKEQTGRDVWGKRQATPAEIERWLNQSDCNGFREREPLYQPCEEDIQAKDDGEKRKK